MRAMAEIKLITGPPCSGKSTYVREHMGEDDARFDYDDMVRAMTTRVDNLVDKHPAHALIMAAREAICSGAVSDADVGTVWITTVSPSLHLLDILSSAAHMEEVKMEATREECLSRLAADASRPDKAAWTALIDDYFAADISGQSTARKDTHIMSNATKMAPVYSMSTDTAGNTDLYLLGDIVESGYEWFVGDTSPATVIDAISQLTSGTLTVHINSYGGAISAGMAIYNALISCKAEVVTICEGFACSAASLIFMAGSRRIMRQASLLMVHHAWQDARGNAAQLRKAADDLDKISQTALSAYRARFSGTDEELQTLFDNESWLAPEASVQMGFATEVSQTSGLAFQSSAFGRISADLSTAQAARLVADRIKSGALTLEDAAKALGWEIPAKKEDETPFQRLFGNFK